MPGVGPTLSASRYCDSAYTVQRPTSDHYDDICDRDGVYFMSGQTNQKLSFFALVVGSAIALKFLPAPFIWIFLGWGAALFAWGFLRRQTNLGVVVFNFAFVVLALAGAEIWLTVAESDEIHVKITHTPDYIRKHPYLGTRPKPSSVNRTTARYGDQLIYDVEYTIGDNGLRVTPPVTANEVDGCVLFFGGSFVYGAGVNDAEALPYQVGVQSDGRYAIYNFGFHGHGPGQMLSALEHGYVDEAIDCNPTHLIYLAIRDHVLRVLGVGRRSFGPKYVSDGNGGVVYSGIFRDSVRIKWLTGVGGYRIRKSKLASRVLDYSRPPGEEEFELFAAVVRQTREITRADYPGSQFHMLVWDNCWGVEDSGVGDLERLSRMMDGVHLATEILPHFRCNAEPYQIHSLDGHPNALAHQMLARYVVAEILKP